MLVFDFSHLGAAYPPDTLSYPHELNSTRSLLIGDLISWACEQYQQKFSIYVNQELVYLATEQGLELLNNCHCSTLGNGKYYLKMVVPFFCSSHLTPHRELRSLELRHFFLKRV
jgi:hypothetical protein